MMHLIDTNVWLERLLSQERTDEVRQLLDRIPSETLYITDFTFHSIGILLCRLNRKEAFIQFVRDIFIDGGVNLVRLEPKDTEYLLEITNKFMLDFDDAYQYVAAENII